MNFFDVFVLSIEADGERGARTVNIMYTWHVIIVMRADSGGLASRNKKSIRPNAVRRLIVRVVLT